MEQVPWEWALERDGRQAIVQGPTPQVLRTPKDESVPARALGKAYLAAAQGVGAAAALGVKAP